jgi:hypothetical protein
VTTCRFTCSVFWYWVESYVWPVCLGIKHPSGAYDQIFIFVWQLRVCWFRAPSWTRGRVCRLQFLLVLASAVIFWSESHGTRGHILLSQIRDFPFRRLIRLAGSRWRYSTPSPRGDMILISINKSLKVFGISITLWNRYSDVWQNVVKLWNHSHKLRATQKWRYLRFRGRLCRFSSQFFEYPATKKGETHRWRLLVYCLANIELHALIYAVFTSWRPRDVSQLPTG